jgi:hypothetical protein
VLRENQDSAGQFVESTKAGPLSGAKEDVGGPDGY